LKTLQEIEKGLTAEIAALSKKLEAVQIARGLMEEPP